jgi:hypothetical protein
MQVRKKGAIFPWRDRASEGRECHGYIPVSVMVAWGTAMPLQDLMGYTRMDFTVAAGSGEAAPPPPPRMEERNEAAFSMVER